MKSTNLSTNPSTPCWFSLAQADEKLSLLPQAVARGLGLTDVVHPLSLGRDVTVVATWELPVKPGIATVEGQARLLHDLASIELQATELAVRGLYEYPEAPAEFRRELAEIALSEGSHLRLCLDGLVSLGYRWGDWPVHMALWNAVSVEDSLLDRILIVHRYLEGSGLDAGESICRRLTGCAGKSLRQTVRTIVDDEVDHVAFGSRWYRQIAQKLKLDPEQEFSCRMPALMHQVPRRERLDKELRRRAGFSEFELNVLQELQQSQMQIQNWT